LSLKGDSGSLKMRKTWKLGKKLWRTLKERKSEGKFEACLKNLEVLIVFFLTPGGDGVAKKRHKGV